MTAISSHGNACQVGEFFLKGKKNKLFLKFWWAWSNEQGQDSGGKSPGVHGVEGRHLDGKGGTNGWLHEVEEGECCTRGRMQSHCGQGTPEVVGWLKSERSKVGHLVASRVNKRFRRGKVARGWSWKVRRCCSHGWPPLGNAGRANGLQVMRVVSKRESQLAKEGALRASMGMNLGSPGR
ncbi:hypothetical protein GOP47_0012189 [Adiantum capillus-veneris]|uniref:Uncharacterized protein n=1 Tax=Adiantum capillus-veneris TaxID=13818 RepID=A0A9D4ZE30_ADICA|nr:hypothetical protein GOP47_0012189 [Adiantum capillus-veneris]